MFTKKYLLIISTLFLLSLNSSTALASSSFELADGQVVKINRVSLATQVDQTATQDAFSIKLSAKSLKVKTEIILENLGSLFDWPWNYSPLSDVYQFDFSDQGLNYNVTEPLRINISYENKNNNYKQIFFFDKNQQKWRPLPSVDDPVNQVVSAIIHLPFARVAILANDEVMTVGQASWYRFKNGLFAASPDFVKGTVLKVSNLENNKSVNVLVNDYGPDRSLHPNRVIDLDSVAFNRIASTRDGLARVKIEVVKFADSVDRIKLEAGRTLPDTISKSALVISPVDGKILYAKNADTVAPLASLTKLLAMKVFLDLKPDFNRVVGYSDSDAAYNHEHVKPWESARLRVSDGETLTIKDLLHATLVGSANNTTETLVRVSGISRSEFIKRMNDLAKEWGALNSTFIEPTGLSPENVSSPLDYAIITKELLQDEILKKISTTPSYSFTSINKEKKYNLKNTNDLIKTNNYQIAVSKTGYLDEAGYCLMTQVDSAKGPLIIVSFNSPTRAGSFNDNKTLIDYGLKRLGQ
ncbi:MAG: hypothetical protein EOM88_00705 [Clostridia bacterium]|nr:hypothetical protein [Clostridia bacterium]